MNVLFGNSMFGSWETKEEEKNISFRIHNEQCHLPSIL